MQKEQEIQKTKVRIVSFTSRPDHIIEVQDNEDWTEPETLEIVKEDTEVLRELLSGEMNKGLFIEVADKHTTKDIIDFYQYVELNEVARALLINSLGAKIMGNLYLRFSGGKPNEAGRVVPLKLFTNKEEAIKWLLDQLEEHKE